MPSNKDFKMSILVGGEELPEYEKDGEFYVESNLHTPVSYLQESEEIVKDEVEKQKRPVTPYEVKITAMPNTPDSLYNVYVDGQWSNAITVKPGESRICQGFYDGVDIKEFLFSLPRFAQDKADRLDEETAKRVGTIKVECLERILLPGMYEMESPSSSRLEYTQANKRDTAIVTNNKYTMITSRVGRTLYTFERGTSTGFRKKYEYRSRSGLSIKYMTGNSLFNMGVKLEPLMSPVDNIGPGEEKEEESLEDTDDDDEVVITQVSPAKRQRILYL